MNPQQMKGKDQRSTVLVLFHNLDGESSIDHPGKSSRYILLDYCIIGFLYRFTVHYLFFFIKTHIHDV